MKNKNRHKYINYFFAAFDFIVVLSCIFKWFGNDIGFYRIMLGLTAFELALRRFSDGLECDNNE